MMLSMLLQGQVHIGRSLTLGEEAGLLCAFPCFNSVPERYAFFLFPGHKNAAKGSDRTLWFSRALG